MRSSVLVLATVLMPLGVLAASGNNAEQSPSPEEQKEELLESAQNKGAGPQSPRDIEDSEGDNPVVFSAAPEPDTKNLCDIHS